ncbi:signal recognition particle subunit [Xylographa vitiligo]|nr:signal recognition particle subunit [Xylographa vitiligo]
MSFNPRIEDLPSSSSSAASDSDPSDMDPMDYMRPTTTTSPPTRIHHLSATTAAHPAPQPAPFTPSPSSQPPQLQPRFRAPTSPAAPAIDPSRYKDWQCLYPVYFDATRSRGEGRRVGKELAVPNPLAREIADAAGGLGLQVVLEVGKTHPRDWANPGRVKVGLKTAGAGGRVKNKHHLYILIAHHLQAHPTTPLSPFRAGMRIAGLPLPGGGDDGEMPPPAKPRGWKMGDVLPLHSPAVSGGGVSENMFKDMMAEMGGAGGVPGMPGMGIGGEGGPVVGSGGAGEGRGKKVKRKVIRA